ncbi:hypothetical protein GMRT_11153 [Giardia muris]|uniref:Uncharacterized protein n=1 Tax=Giardia muris TaxID=5742 RepID=A0A4Z1SU60_GIAMU|nr:hypothetical protein GMRT_11153 [Giardia muris]|eukprot:TNJ29384.1 hypothetical protein GMRT_11153 [Giardia muris]
MAFELATFMRLTQPRFKEYRPPDLTGLDLPALGTFTADLERLSQLANATPTEARKLLRRRETPDPKPVDVPPAVPVPPLEPSVNLSLSMSSVPVISPQFLQFKTVSPKPNSAKYRRHIPQAPSPTKYSTPSRRPVKRRSPESVRNDRLRMEELERRLQELEDERRYLDERPQRSPTILLLKEVETPTTVFKHNSPTDKGQSILPTALSSSSSPTIVESLAHSTRPLDRPPDSSFSPYDILSRPPQRHYAIPSIPEPLQATQEESFAKAAEHISRLQEDKVRLQAPTQLSIRREERRLTPPSSTERVRKQVMVDPQAIMSPHVIAHRPLTRQGQDDPFDSFTSHQIRTRRESNMFDEPSSSTHNVEQRPHEARKYNSTASTTAFPPSVDELIAAQNSLEELYRQKLRPARNSSNIFDQQYGMLQERRQRGSAADTAPVLAPEMPHNKTFDKPSTPHLQASPERGKTTDHIPKTSVAREVISTESPRIIAHLKTAITPKLLTADEVLARRDLKLSDVGFSMADTLVDRHEFVPIISSTIQGDEGAIQLVAAQSSSGMSARPTNVPMTKSITTASGQFLGKSVLDRNVLSVSTRLEGEGDYDESLAGSGRDALQRPLTPLLKREKPARSIKFEGLSELSDFTELSATAADSLLRTTGNIDRQCGIQLANLAELESALSESVLNAQGTSFSELSAGQASRKGRILRRNGKPGESRLRHNTVAGHDSSSDNVPVATHFLRRVREQ